MIFKDITISKDRQVKELKLFALFFGLACLANLLSIIVFKTSVIELITQLHIVLLLAFIGYSILGIGRLVYFGTLSLLDKNK